MLPFLQAEPQPEPLPIAETAGVVLLISVIITIAWLAYLYR